jgi:hypothetical protein
MPEIIDTSCPNLSHVHAVNTDATEVVLPDPASSLVLEDLFVFDLCVSSVPAVWRWPCQLSSLQNLFRPFRSLDVGCLALSPLEFFLKNFSFLINFLQFKTDKFYQIFNCGLTGLTDVCAC